MEAVLISYVPLLVGEAGRTDLDPNDLSEIFDQTPSGLAEGCVWLMKDDEMTPCLIMENAAAIADHLKAWAEGKPEEWFTLVMSECGPLYGMALMPRLEKGEERFRIAYHLRNGLPFPKDASVRALFKPLHFSSKPGHMFGRVKPRLGKQCSLFLIDSADIDMADIAATDWENCPIELGRFELEIDSSDKSYIVQMLKGNTQNS